MFATGSDDRSVRLWSMSDMTLLARTDLDQKARSLGFSPDGSHLAVGLGDGSFMVLKARYEAKWCLGDLEFLLNLFNMKRTVPFVKC